MSLPETPRKLLEEARRTIEAADESLALARDRDVLWQIRTAYASVAKAGYSRASVILQMVGVMGAQERDRRDAARWDDLVQSAAEATAEPPGG